MSKRQWLLGAVGGALLAGLAPSADAALMIELRPVNPPEPGTSIIVEPGAVIELELFASVTQGGGRGLQILQGSFVSAGGPVRGRFEAAGDLDEATEEILLPALNPFNSSGAAPGRQNDIDGDGDLDLGGAPGAPTADFVALRASSIRPQTGANAAGRVVGRVNFHVEGVEGDIGEPTLLRFDLRRGTDGNITEQAAVYREEVGATLTGINGQFELTGTAIFAIPEPGTLSLLSLGALGLLARRRTV